jgi:hypothetical protein
MRADAFERGLDMSMYVAFRRYFSYFSDLDQDTLRLVMRI